jgi:hypothetical protein
MIGLAGCESNGGLRVAGVGSYSLGTVEGQEEYRETFDTESSFSDEGSAARSVPTQFASFSPNLDGQTLLARAGNSPLNAPSTDAVRIANVPAGAAALLRAALPEGSIPGRTLANLIRPASGAIIAGTAPVVGAITDVASGVVAPLAPVTAPVTTAASNVVAGSVGAVGAVAGGTIGTVGAVAGGTVGAVGGTLNNGTGPIIAGVAGPVVGAVNAVPGAVGGIVQDVVTSLPLASGPGAVSTAQPTLSGALTPVGGVIGGLLRATR